MSTVEVAPEGRAPNRRLGFESLQARSLRQRPPGLHQQKCGGGLRGSSPNSYPPWVDHIPPTLIQHPDVVATESPAVGRRGAPPGTTRAEGHWCLSEVVRQRWCPCESALRMCEEEVDQVARGIHRRKPEHALRPARSTVGPRCPPCSAGGRSRTRVSAPGRGDAPDGVSRRRPWLRRGVPAPAGADAQPSKVAQSTTVVMAPGTLMPLIVPPWYGTVLSLVPCTCRTETGCAASISSRRRTWLRRRTRSRRRCRSGRTPSGRP